MFKKLVTLLCVSMLSVMPNSSFAGGPDFESLFGKNSSWFSTCAEEATVS